MMSEDMDRVNRWSLSSFWSWILFWII